MANTFSNKQFYFSKFMNAGYNGPKLLKDIYLGIGYDTLIVWEPT